MKFNCNLCNYLTENKSNYNRHINSNKHMLNNNQLNKNILNDNRLNNNILNSNQIIDKPCRNSYLCEKCEKAFHHRSGLYKHKRKCFEYNECNDKINELVKEIKELKEKQENHQQQQLTKIIEMRKEIKNELKDQLTNISNNTYNISIINYIQKNYSDAPYLSKLDDYSIIDSDNSLINTLIYHHNHDMLPHCIGNLLVKYYKKEDPSQQSIWNSDASRLTYVIKELLANNQTSWNRDSKGLKTKEYIIIPMLNYIKQYICDYIDKSTSNISNLTTKQCTKIVEEQVKLGLIIQYINTNLAEDIVKYIAPYFNALKQLTI